MKLKTLLSAVLITFLLTFLITFLLTFYLLPASLSSAEAADAEMSLGGIRIGMTLAEVEERYGAGEVIADCVETWNGERVGAYVIAYPDTLMVSCLSMNGVPHVRRVHIGVDKEHIAKNFLAPLAVEAQGIEGPHGLHIGSTAEDLQAAFGYLPEPKHRNTTPDICTYVYEHDGQLLTFYICPEAGPEIRAITLSQKR